LSIAVADLSKRYWLRGHAPGTFQQALARFAGALRRGQPFWALRDVSFRLDPGEPVGIIGHNGAGKSTLLRLICGLGRPTRGAVSVEGRVAALLELGVGFHPQLSGRENLYVSAIVSGMRRSEVDARYRAIVDFAGIEPFIEQPLRTFSSGMQVRLAFAVAIHVDPAILIVDEALSVGDAEFQEKCVERIEAFHRAGRTLLVASHDMHLVRRFCSRALLLDHGRLVADGPASEVTAVYEASSARTEGAPGRHDDGREA
jgi:homopolymeric O-antigen transport system ATP-binding protein